MLVSDLDVQCALWLKLRWHCFTHCILYVHRSANTLLTCPPLPPCPPPPPPSQTHTPQHTPTGQGRWRFKIPVLVSDLDVQCALWLKLRLAPMCPWIGTISLAFVGPPAVKVQLSPYNRVRLMRIPVLQVRGGGQ